MTNTLQREYAFITVKHRYTREISKGKLGGMFYKRDSKDVLRRRLVCKKSKAAKSKRWTEDTKGEGCVN